MRNGAIVLLSLCSFHAACGNDGVASASTAKVDLKSVPGQFLPGSLVALRPVFGAGIGRIEPDVGPVESGKAYVVGPFSESRTYTLRVEDGPNVSAKQLVVPFRYREQLTELSPGTIARSEHAAASLPDGTILIVGGRSTGVGANATAERYDPLRFAFEPVGNQSVGRRDPAIVVEPQLADGSMTALSFGGAAQETIPGIGTVVERWNSAQRAWSNLGNLSADRTKHTATQFAGGRTLVLGGEASGSDPARLAGEIWTDAVGSRAPLVPIATHRIGHTATKLGDGSVLVIGGVDAATGQQLATAEIFDPLTEGMVPAGALAIGRSLHAALLVDGGRVLVIGGTDGFSALRSCEIWDPAKRAFAASGDLVQAVSEVRALRIGSGEVLVVGGQTATRGASSTMQAWSPQTSAFRVFGNGLPAPRSGHSLTLMDDGRVLLLGGDAGADFPVATAWWID